MDKLQLTDKEVDALLNTLKPVEVDADPSTYRIEPAAKADYEEQLDRASKVQELDHKERLMTVVSYLAKESFKLLALIVVAQMVIKLFKPDYSGVSDDVIKVIAISVFGQVIVIVGALATYLFKKRT